MTNKKETIKETKIGKKQVEGYKYGQYLLTEELLEKLRSEKHIANFVENTLREKFGMKTVEPIGIGGAKIDYDLEVYNLTDLIKLENMKKSEASEKYELKMRAYGFGITTEDEKEIIFVRNKEKLGGKNLQLIKLMDKQKEAK